MDDILTSLVKLVLFFIVGSFLLGFAGGLLKAVLRFLAGLTGKTIGRLLPYALLLTLVIAPFLIISHYGLHRWIFLGISILTSAYMSIIGRKVHELWMSTYRCQYANSYESINACEGARRSFIGSPVLWSEGFKAVCMALISGMRDYEFGSRWGVVSQKCPKIIYMGHRLIVLCAVIMFSLFSLSGLCVSIVALSLLCLARVIVWCELEIICVFVPKSRAPHCPNCNGQSEMVCSCGQRIPVQPSIMFGLFAWKCNSCGRLLPTLAFLRDTGTQYVCPTCGTSVSAQSGSSNSGFRWPWMRNGSSGGNMAMGKLSGMFQVFACCVFRMVSCPFVAIRSRFRKSSVGGTNANASTSGTNARKCMTLKGRPVALCCLGDSTTQRVVEKLLVCMSKKNTGAQVTVISAVDPASAYVGQLSNDSIVCQIRRGMISRKTSLFLLTDTEKHSKLLTKNAEIVMLFVASGVAVDSALLNCPKGDASKWLFALGDRMAEIRRCGLMECSAIVLPGSESMPQVVGDGSRDAEDFLERAGLSDMLSRLFKSVSYKYLTIDAAADYLLE